MTYVKKAKRKPNTRKQICEPFKKFALKEGKLIFLEQGFQRETDSKLFNAIDSKNQKRVKELLEKGADSNSRNIDGCTPLITAAWNKSHNIMRLLLEKGADPNAIDGYGFHAINAAEYWKDETAISILKEFKAKDLKITPRKRGPVGSMPL